MKFGKYIQNHRLAEWSSHYMDYKALKKIINSLGTSQQRFQFTKTAFFYQLERELEKVNEFYMQKESDLKQRLRTLLEKKKVWLLRPPNQVYRTSYIALKEAFTEFQHDLDKLQQFVEINGTGFRKILKKWDKRSKSTTKELYLSRQVEVQPCFNRDIIGELSDTATTHLGEILNKIDELPSSSAAASLVLPTTALHSPSGSSNAISETPSHTHYGKSEPQLFEALLNDQRSVIQGILDKYQTQPTTTLPHQVSSIDSPPNSSPNIHRLFSALFWRACSEGLWNDSMELVARSGLVDFTYADDINDRTCLHQAAIHGLVGLVQVLVATRQLNDVDHVDYYGRTALHYAAMHGRVDFLSLLLETAPQLDLSTVDHDGNDVLIYAVIRGSIPCVAVLLEHQQASKPYNYNHALVVGCQYGHLDMVALMLAKGVRLALDTGDTSLLHIAAREGHPALCRLLIGHGAKVNLQDKDNTWTPLFYAANEGHQETVQVLLDAGCRLDLLDEAGSTPVYYAAVNGHVDVVGLLHQAGCPVPSPLSDQASPATTTSTITVSSALTDVSQLPVSTSFLPGDTLSRSRDVTALLQASPSHPLGSASFDNSHIDESHSFTLPDSVQDIDMDGIPSLSLPPPVIPVRTYGHRYLDDKCYLQLLFRNQSSSTRNSPVQIQGYTELSTLRLVICPKPDQGVILRTLMLPLDEDPSVVGFLLPRDAPFNIEFSVYPSFGSKILGKAVVLGSSLGLTTHQNLPLPTKLTVSAGSDVAASASTLSKDRSCTSVCKPTRLQSNRSHGSLVCPLLDTHLKVVGEIALGYVLIKPLSGVKLQIGGPIPTYWKSTNTTHPQHSVGSILNSPLSTLSMGPTSSHVASPAFPTVPAAYLSGGADSHSSGPDASTMFALRAPDEASPSLSASNNPTGPTKSKLSRSRSGSGTPLTQPHAPPTLVSGNPLIALVTSSSLANEHVHLIVQVTRDFVPVVYPWSQLDIIDGVQLSVTAMTAAQFRHVGLQKIGFLGKDTVDAEEEGKRVKAHLLSRVRHVNQGVVPRTIKDWHGVLHRGFFTLVEVFQLLPLALGVSIELKYPHSPVSLPEADSADMISAALSPTVASVKTHQASERSLTIRVGRGVGSDDPDINQYVDAVLHTIYTTLSEEQNATSMSTEDTAKLSPYPAAPFMNSTRSGKPRNQRNIFFSSFHPGICTALNWKQPNYPVFFSTMCGTALPTLGNDYTYPSRSKNPQEKACDVSKPPRNPPLLTPENQPQEGKSEGATTQAKRARGNTTTPTYSHMEHAMECSEVDQPLGSTSSSTTIDQSHCFRKDGPLTRSSFSMSLTNPASIKDAIRFAGRNHLLGLLCDAQLLVRVPSLITTIKQSGLVLATFGQANCFPENLELQGQYGVDAILADGVFQYNRSDPMELV